MNESWRAHNGHLRDEECYFLDDGGLCLGRPADTCPWAKQVGPWAWQCVNKEEEEKMIEASIEQTKGGLEEVALDLLVYLDYMAEDLPQSVAGKFSQREPVALRDRLRKVLTKEAIRRRYGRG